MEKIRDWFENLSGATKYMIILCVLLTICNILIFIWGVQKSNDAAMIMDVFFSEEKKNLFLLFNIGYLFEKMRTACITILCFVINIIGYVVSYYIGKILGFFESVIELFIDIKNDGWGYFFIMLYNVISFGFDILTIMSFVTL